MGEPIARHSLRPLLFEGSSLDHPDARRCGNVNAWLFENLKNYAPCHCERSEAIQSSLERCWSLDCLVAPVQNRFAILSRAPRK
jgi:hypothetical protein